MARSIEKLSAVAVNKRKEPGRMSDGGGLYLSVSSASSKSWVFMWTVGGRRREMGLGPYPAVSLKAAREKAAEYRTLTAEGRDPIVEREKNKKLTFGDCAELYIAAMEGTWRNEKHKYQWRQTLGCDDTGVKRRIVYCDSLRPKPVADISTQDVLEVLSPIWVTKAETASRIRSRIELVLDFAKAKGWREGDNPARWRGHLRNVLGPRKKLVNGHLAAMPYREVPAFIARLKGMEAVAARALEFTILTACRTSEVLKARWTEFALEEGIWTIPKTRMKGGEEHVVPLSKAAIAIVNGLRVSGSAYVFPGNRSGKNKGKAAKEIGPLSNMSMEMLLRRMKVENATVHGFRSSFRDWCGDETDFPREIAEAALAHKVGNAVEQAYRRGKAIEKRRKLMEAWADYCNAAEARKVVTLRPVQA